MVIEHRRSEFRAVPAMVIEEVLPVVRFDELAAGCAGGGDCAVCLSGIDGGDEVRQLTNCRHAFHRGCFDRWMEHDQRTCPLCRAPLIPDEMAGALWAAAAGVPDASDFDFSYFGGAPLAPVPSPTLLPGSAGFVRGLRKKTVQERRYNGNVTEVLETNNVQSFANFPVDAAASGGWDFRNAYRRQLLALSRRVRLLGPFAEELREARAGSLAGGDQERALEPLADALETALDLLRLGRDGSRIFLVLERDNIMKKFQGVIAQLEQALCDFPYDKLDISDEVREQVELVHAQLRRAKERADMPDDEFYNDVLSLYNKSYDPSAELDILERSSEKLHLMTITDLTQESLALHEMVASGGGQDPGEHIEKMSTLLKKIKDFVQTQNPEMGPPIGTKLMDSNGEPRPANIPDEFHCPISLELMKDPVIVSTGQIYERVCIEKWIASGHHTCPNTQQRMANTTLTTNYVLRSLIAQWCEANGIEPPKRSSQPNKPTLACSSSERASIDALLAQLCSPDPEEQRSAAAELRLLAKRNANNRICIAEAGAIPLLLSLLSSSDLRTQEHAVTALLNLSIHEDNKASIISSGAVPSIVHVLKNGSMEARENAAATLFSLSVIDEYKVTIGGTGAIPALVVLLSEGSQRGKKDAAGALFNLCIYQGNKGRAIRAGLVPLIMGLVTNPTGALIDEAMAILSILSSHPEGKAAIGAAEPVPVLVEMIGSGSPRNRENAAAVMLHLSSSEQQLVHLARAQECGIMVPLWELALNGTDRGKRKAVHLLERMSRFLVQQQEEKEAQLLASTQAIPQITEQVQQIDIPEQLDSPSPQYPTVA